MERAKAAVQDFISGDGKHKTTVDEDIRAPVTEEHIKPHQHDEVTTAVDRSVHVDHHHTTVQPVSAKETLPEQHTHNIMPVEHKTVHHGDERELKETLDRDVSKYHDTSTTHHTTHSASTAPVAVGERTHHHVHEHVQPVIQKEVVAPQVVHTTVPVHETHHVGAQHHGTSVLPAKTLEEFKSTGASLEGRTATKVGEFDGQPKPYDRSLQSEQLDGDRHMSGSSGHHHGREGVTAAAAGAGGIAAAEGLSHHNKREGDGLTGTSTTHGSGGLTGTSGTTGAEHSHSSHHHGREGAAAAATGAGGFAAAEGLSHHNKREGEGLTGTSATHGAGGLTGTSTTHGAEGLTGTSGTTGADHSHSSHHHGREGAAAAAGVGGVAAAEGLSSHHHKREGDGLTGTSTSRGTEGFTNTSTTSRGAEGLTSTTGHDHSHTGHSHAKEGAAAGGAVAAAEGLSSSRHHREADGLTGTSTTREAEGLTGTTGTGTSHTREGMANTSTATHPTSTSTTGAGTELGQQADRAFFSGPHDNSKLTSGTTGDRHHESSALGSGIGGISNAEKVNHEGAYGGPGVATSGTTSGTTSATHTEERKVSLADKLNPFKDADGDGKKGFMS